MKTPLTLSDCLDLELESMKKLGCSREEMLRVAVQRYNELQDMKPMFFGLFKRKYMDADELVEKMKRNERDETI